MDLSEQKNYLHSYLNRGYLTRWKADTKLCIQLFHILNHYLLHAIRNVAGIMVTKAGFQEGAKKFAKQHGISLKGLRNPTKEECIIGKLITTTSANIRHTLLLVLVNEEWATNNGYDFQAYRRRLDMFHCTSRWSNSSHMPIELNHKNICDASGKPISFLDALEKKIPSDHKGIDDITFTFEDAYVNAK